jgi:D-alanine transaminase
VDKDGNIVTRDLSHAILPGVTRREIMDAAAEAQIAIVERKFTPAEAITAKEAFITAATLGATPITSIDGHKIGDGTPGPVARRLQDLYLRRAEKLASTT